MTVPLYNLTDTWTVGATVYTAIQMNVTDTASDATSELIDLQVGGATRFSVRKDARAFLANATTATSLFAYNTVDTPASPTNYERAVFDWTTTSNVLTIGTQKGGTGSTRNIRFVAGSSNIGDFGITTSNNWTFWGTINLDNSGVIRSNDNTGIVSTGGDVSFSSNSGNKNAWAFRSGTINFNASSDAVLCWTGTAANTSLNGPDGTVDIGLARNAAGVLEVDNGTAGTFRDLLVRTVIHNGVTVAALPASPVAGMVAYVTDGTASLAWGATVTGGSSTKYLVWYNGTNWTVAGK